MKKFRLLLFYYLLILCSCSIGKKQSANLSSPDQQNRVEFRLSANGEPEYSVYRGDLALIKASKLGFVFKGEDAFNRDFELVAQEVSSENSTWEPVFDQHKSIQNHYNQLKVELKEKAGKERELTLIFRAFNDGVAFRYFIPEQKNISEIEILSEETEFNFNQQDTAWWIPGDFNSYEKIYKKTRVTAIDSANTPVTLKTKEGIHMSIHEANLTDYSDMTLKPNAKGILAANLVPWPDGIKVKGKAPMETPWRTIQISENAGGLLESSLILNLNEPCKIKDPSWIQPMKYMGVWWTVHLGFETFEVGKHQAAVTQKAKRMIDYAHKFGIKGVLVEGWNKGWDLRGKSDEIPNYLEAEENYDIKEVAEYAQKKGIELIIHHETFGNIAHYEKYMDASFQMIKDLGLNAVKGGYAGTINPADQYKHGQFMIRHYRKQLETAAKYGIMLDVHEPIKQTGLRRTYPNLMTVEGVRGMEFEAWSKGNPPSHTVTIPFTRMLGGPVDYNAGIFDIKFNSLKKHKFNWRMPKKKYPKNPGPCVKTTLAKQLALHVVFYSPMQMSPDLPENYEGHPAFQFLQDVDVVWDDTKVINAAVGEYLTIARKGKNSDNWFIGSITDEKARTFEVNLNFLDAGKKYKAIVYADGEDAHWDQNPTSYQIFTKEVSKDSVLTLDLKAGGGQAISIMPL